jgi:DNA invertase Pin-like site-specific DNA recombinase
MTYGYVRVSTDKQRVDNQEYEITRFCQKNNLAIDEWIKETISGTKTPDKRKLGGLLDKIQSGDLIICAELSRLGRSLFMIMTILNKLMAIEAKVWTIKDNYRLGDDIQSKVLAFAFGLSAEIERDLISQRTREALALRRAEGVILGRPLGKKSSHVKLSGYEKEIKKLIKERKSKTEIGRILEVNRMTLSKFMKDNNIPEPTKKPIYNTRKPKLKGKEKQIKELIEKEFNINEICKILNVSKITLKNFMKNNGLETGGGKQNE